MADYVDRTIGDLTVRIDRELCIGSGNCMNAAPELFEFDDRSVCAFKPAPPALARDEVLEACRVCPVGALIATDRDGRQLVP